ncbi:MAG: hypothetical protein FWG31_09240 [Oscillospiraceae bacterium]|nr:hypothetical protein [Oscillospiraceae bacterium]
MNMKLKTLALAMIILLSALSGCSVSTPSTHVDGVDDDTPDVTRRTMQWVEIPVGEDTVFAKEVLKLIETSKNIRERDEGYALISRNELPKIKEFYNLDKFKIEGYELGSAFVNSTNFIFQYFRDKNKTTGMYGRIVVTIPRPDWVDANLPNTDLLIHSLEGQDLERVKITENDMLYFEDADMIKARLGRTTVTIQPIGIKLDGGYEELRDLALRVIESAELVTVKG